jgi:hypothetical protein
MCILDQDLEADACPGNGFHLYCLIKQHDINWVIAYSLICNRNLAYGKGTTLEYCDMISTASNFDMVIITLGRLFFMLSCRLTPINAPCSMGDVCIEKLWAPCSGHAFHQ